MLSPSRSLLSLVAPARMAALASSAAKQPVKDEHVKSIDREQQESSSFGMNLFRGRIQVEEMFPFPNVMTEDQNETLQMLVPPTAKFFSEVNNAAKNDELCEVEPKTLEGLKGLGAFGLLVPEEYGGPGLNNSQYARMGEIMGANDLGLGIALGAHQSIGYKGILLFGTPEQKKKYLPDLAAGNKWASFALTEPSSGSDANSIRTRAELSPDGKHYILNGNKIWISNGGLAEVFTVFAQTPTKAKDGLVKDKVTAFIVERGFGGVTNGPPESKMGIKASNTAEVHFDNTKIPVENRLLGEGDGFKVAMQILNNGRFGMAAAMTGTMRTCIAAAVDHASQRVQFGRKLDTFGDIRAKIADMVLRHYVTESMAYMISSSMDAGATEYQIEAAISKIYGSESAWNVCDETIQIMGGMGFMKEPGLERIMRDLRIFRIFEGTNDILRMFVALTGIQHAGGHLKDMVKALQNPIGNPAVVFGEAAKRAKRAVGFSTIADGLAHRVHPDLVQSANAVTRNVELFGAGVEHLLIKYRQKVLEEQSLLRHLADAAIDIYSQVVVLSRASTALEKQLPSAQHEKHLAALLCNAGSERIATNLNALSSASRKEQLQSIDKIAQDVFEAQGIVSTHPLGI